MMYNTSSQSDKVPKSNQEDDAVLVKSAQDNPERFDILYKKYRDKIFSYFFYRVGRNCDTAEELTQETFLRAFKAFSHFTIQNCSYLTYLLRIAHNLLVNHYRSSKLVLLENINDLRTTTMDEQIEAKVEAEKVWKGIDNNLTKAERKAMYLKYRKDWAVKEIAQTMQRSTNAVKLLLSHARKKIRTIEPYYY